MPVTGLVMLAGFAFEGFPVYRGWTTGRITVPRSSSTAVRGSSPVLFATYLALHLPFTVVLGAGGLLFAFG